MTAGKAGRDAATGRDAGAGPRPRPGQPTRRRRRWLRRLLYGCLGLVLLSGAALALAEWYLRRHGGRWLGMPAQLNGMCEADDARSVRTVAGWRGEQTVEGRTTPIRINALGLRGDEVPPKQAGERRVLVVGDSIVFGQGVADVEAFPAVLERLLHQRLGGEVRVGNAGVPAHGTYEMARSVRRSRGGFAPDAVVACPYLGNDFVDDAQLHRAVIDGFVLTGPIARLAQASWRMRLALRFRVAIVVEQFLDEHFPALAIDRQALAMSAEEAEALAGLPPLGQQFAGLFADRAAADALVDKMLQRCRRHLAAVRDAAAPAPVLVAIVPSYWHVDAAEYRATLARLGLDPLAHQQGVAQRRLAAVCGELGLPVLDLTPLLRAASDPARLWLPLDRHFSVAGHGAVAGWLAPVVAELLAR